MSPTLTVSTQIEIAATPAAVRSVFIDFARYTQWQQGWKFEPGDSDKQPLDLKPGDGLKVKMNGTSMQPIVMENSANSFQWEGSLLGLMKGVHQFHFTPSEINLGGTTFTHKEDLRGILITLSSPLWSSGEISPSSWNQFNSDLKKEVEKSLA
ncbi:hypothetical protein CI102_9031 [Trichoderma harzianum]|uniref:Activator of Hsp90 ATPase N-terminal domain-containing protein n=1 Tax=Trichoderma harzianum CBS 226.95 TaxID=983964 RepID=A0A2T3ZTL5_TRIHA|nr:hypothetical protein M431DRAFT_156110 [Trichoderma harzianum CBS 226.95]PKK45772.1 hypothetical protein CI102_9031 [Trichoderma harzianum]PTB48144.1 hypothetical protein M431DRAFT_156110 [Trichoderma harzianum CBS 226.95]